MPQMGPLMWTYLYMTFSLMILISMIKIYFNTNSGFNKSNQTIKIKTNLFNWKW